MENTYYLIVEQQAAGRCLRTIDEYASADRLVADAADYEAGEFPGALGRRPEAVVRQFGPTDRRPPLGRRCSRCARRTRIAFGMAPAPGRPRTLAGALADP